ncbi:MAG: 4Fe-4S binding protein [Candidatus Atribacteria bacterium]|nr:4Fe-4S binding protein [Candidatus Atribacteria bacterium]
MLNQKENRKLQAKSRFIRFLVLIVILGISTLLGILHQVLLTRPPVGVDALCPFGALESAYTLIATKTMLNKIATSSFLLLISTLLVAIFFRRVFCGLICPFGTLQELFGRIGKKIFRKKILIPKQIDRFLRYWKYLGLGLIVFFSAYTGTLVQRPYDPWVTYHHLSSSDLFSEFNIGFLILLFSLVGSLLYDRFFCKYLCPMGAFLALINKLSFFRIERNESTCIKCRACDRICPVNIEVSKEKIVHSPECINCNECVTICPVPDTLLITNRKKTRFFSPLAVLGITVLLFFIVISITSLTGNFQWTVQSLTEQVKIKGDFDPNLITGRMTFMEVSAASGIPKEIFLNEFRISEEDLSIPFKDLKNKYPFETENVREFLKQFIEK